MERAGMRAFLLIAGIGAISVIATYPVYLHALRSQRQREAALQLAAFDRTCSLARLRLSGGGEFWSARIMANRCDAAGR